MSQDEKTALDDVAVYDDRPHADLGARRWIGCCGVLRLVQRCGRVLADVAAVVAEQVDHEVLLRRRRGALRLRRRRSAPVGLRLRFLVCRGSHRTPRRPHTASASTSHAVRSRKRTCGALGGQRGLRFRDRGRRRRTRLKRAPAVPSSAPPWAAVAREAGGSGRSRFGRGGRWRRSEASSSSASAAVVFQLGLRKV